MLEKESESGTRWEPVAPNADGDIRIATMYYESSAVVMCTNGGCRERYGGDTKYCDES